MKQRLKTIRGEPENDEERAILMRCLALIEAESPAGKAVKEAQASLDRAVLARYATLTEAEIKTLVVEDKWCASIRAAIDDEVQRLTQRLTRRVQELEAPLRPAPAGAGAGGGGGGVQRQDREASQADGSAAMSKTLDFEHLVGLCRRAHQETQRSTARAVDRYLVTRNWLFGWYIVEYEQSGADRAEYGAALIKRLADKLTIRGCSSRSLALSCKFYRCYSEILQTPSAQSSTLPPDERLDASRPTFGSPVARDGLPAIVQTSPAQLASHHVRWRCLRNSPHSVGPIRSPVARGIALPGRRNRPARSPVLPRLVSLRHPPDYRQRRGAAVLRDRGNGQRLERARAGAADRQLPVRAARAQPRQGRRPPAFPARGTWSRRRPT